MCQWAKKGRLKLDDGFMTPETFKWKLVERDPTLSALIPRVERLILKRGEDTGSNYEFVQSWARKGQVSPEDMIYSSYTQLWARVSDLPSIMEHIPDQVIQQHKEKQKRRKNFSNFDPSSEKKFIEFL